jgi:hypothetical protein
MYGACYLNQFFLVLTWLSVHGYSLGALISMCLSPLLNSLVIIQTYDYTCSFNEEVMYPTHPFFTHWWYLLLSKVDVSAWVAMDHGKRPLYRYTIRSISLLHRASVQCVHLQHIASMMNWHVILVNFINETPDVCEYAMDCWLVNDADRTSPSEMPYDEHYFGMYVHGTWLRILTELTLLFAAISLISAICSECTCPSHKHMRIPDPDSDICRLFYSQNICSLE